VNGEGTDEVIDRLVVAAKPEDRHAELIERRASPKR
jgi:hypothetical protein